MPEDRTAGGVVSDEQAGVGCRAQVSLQVVGVEPQRAREEFVVQWAAHQRGPSYDGARDVVEQIEPFAGVGLDRRRDPHRSVREPPLAPVHRQVAAA